MNNLLLVSQITISISLMILILLQQRGSSLGSAFGGSGEFYSARRGAEKKIFWATVVLGTAFIASALLNITI